MKRDSATLTIRNLPARVVRGLKALARRRNQSMEQEVRDILEEYVAERASVLKQIEASWERQSRRPTGDEIDAWIAAGRDLIVQHPEVDTVVLECTNLPPYKKALEAALGLPVYDVLDLLSAFYADLSKRR